MLLMPFYYLLFFITLFVPGYVAIRSLGIFKKSAGAELSLGYATTILLYALLATLSYVANISSNLTQLLTIIAIFVSLFLLVKRGYYLDIWKLRFPLICILILSTFTTLFVSLPFRGEYSQLPDPKPVQGSNYRVFDVKLLNIAQTQANDNSIPYRQAQFFSHRFDPAKDPFIPEWSVNFFVRTPLMGAVTANYFNLLEEKPPTDLIWRQSALDSRNTYVQFQILAHILNSLFILPAFFLLTKFFNRKTATLTCLFITVNQYFLYNAFFSWPKSLVAFFILTAWLLLMEKKQAYSIPAGIMLAAAYLTHDLAVLFVGSTMIYLLFSRRIKDMLWVAIPPLIFVMVWISIAGRVYNQPSNFIYYPVSLHDIPQPSQHEAVLQEFLHTSPFHILYIRLQNIFYLLLPYQLFSAKLNGTLYGTLWGLSLYSIPGALGLGLLPAAVMSIFRRFGGWGLWTLTIVPVLLESVIIGWPFGLGALHFAEASVVLLMGVSVYLLTTLKKSYWVLVAYFVNLAGLLLFMGYSYRFALGAWFGSVSDCFNVFAMTGLLVLVSTLVYWVLIDKTPKWLGA